MKKNFTSLFAFLTTILVLLPINYSVAQAPVNDECNNATLLPITLDSVCILATNVGATASTTAPLVTGDGNGYAGDDVWFKFVAPESGRVVIRTGSTDSTANITEGGLALYSGNCGPSLNQLALSTEGLNGSYMPRLDTDDYNISLTEGTTYYIRFWSYDNFEHGWFHICIWTVPVVAGNTCAEATPLYPTFNCNYREFHNLYATPSTSPTPPMPTCGNYSSGSTSTGDVWFSVVVPPNGHLIVETEAGSGAQGLTDCAMQWYRGTCANLTRIECNDDQDFTNTMPKIERNNLVPGETIYIRVWDRQCNERGYFKICAYTVRPSNDDCNTAFPLMAPVVEDDTCIYRIFSNYGATNTNGFGTPPCGNYQGGDVWFTVDVQAGLRTVITTQFGDIFNAGMAVYSGTCGEGLSLITCESGGMPEMALQGFTEDQTLYIRFWSMGNIEQGTFGICAYTTNEVGVAMGLDREAFTFCDEHNSLIITDDGINNDYSPNRDDTLTIRSGDPERSFVVLKFLEMDIRSVDTLFIYNGETADPENLTYKFGYKQVSWANNSNNFGIGEETGLTITAFFPNDTGAITLRFKTGYSDTTTGTGFRLRATCTVLCQPIEVDMESMMSTVEYHPSGEPVEVLVEDGRYFINMCPLYDTLTDSITFYAEVNYPYGNGDFNYIQNDSNSLFTWRIGSEVIKDTGLMQMTIAAPAGKATSVNLIVSDVRGCIAPNIASYWIRASQNPINNVDLLMENAHVCAGDILNVTFGYNDSCLVNLKPIGGVQSSSLAVTDTIFLPDGRDCSPYGRLYRSPVVFDAFSANDYIQSVEDILSVCINMEHSYIGDIRISLECPNGNSVMLLPDYQRTGWPSSASTSSWMGDASEVDDSGDGCTASDYSMGNGWNYCWSENITEGYIYSSSTNGYIYETQNIISHNNTFHGPRSTIDSTNVAEMSQVYHPVQSFSNLIDCPMNGTWFIEVEDTWGSDNGFIFEWEMTLGNRLALTDIEYEVNIKEIIPIGPFIVEDLTTDSNFVIAPPSTTPAGLYEYSFILIDDYDCEFQMDSTFSVEVFQAHSSLYEIDWCQGDEFDSLGFYIASPQTASNGISDTTIYMSRYDMQTASHGCDSSLAIALTIHPEKNSFHSGQICYGDSYNLDGFSVINPPVGNWIYRKEELTPSGCDSTATLNLEVVSTPDIEILGTLNVCKGASTTLTVMGGVGNCTYLWNTGATTQSIEVTPENDTYYSVTIETELGCIDATGVTVFVSNYTSPDVHIEGNLNIYCGSETTLTAVDIQNATVHYEWRANGEIMEGETGPSIVVNPTATTIYSVTTTTIHDCADYVDAIVEVTGNPISIEATKDSILYGEETKLTAHHGNHTTFSYQWFANGVLQDETSDTFIVTSDSILGVGNVQFYVVTTTANGCIDTTYYTINIQPYFASPQNPQALDFTADTTATCQAKTTWDAPDPNLIAAGGVFKGYNIYREGETVPLNETPVPADLQEYIDPTSLIEGTYTYCITAVYLIEGEIHESERVCASIEVDAEYNEVVEVTHDRTENCEATLTWKTPEKNCWANLSGYYIYRNGVLIADIPSDTTSTYTDNTVGEYEYTYSIVAYYKVKDKIRTSTEISHDVNTCYYVAANVYPNPANHEVTVTANSMERIMIYDESGRFIRQVNVSESDCRSKTISTRSLSAGTYLFKIYTKDNYEFLKRVIILH